MKRVSKIKEPAEFDTETRREMLRELRSQRHRRNVVTISMSIAIMVCAAGTTGLRVPLLPFVVSLLSRVA
ncbi:MAG: hypothetical protein QOF06_485 [Solirubrobacterales bacterium]|jgi:hypothetical protein|nr:hypothetical protein [Solirubrobacterales bacterium]